LTLSSSLALSLRHGRTLLTLTLKQGLLGTMTPWTVCEIGSVVAARGEVKQVKVLGTLALIDEGMS